MPRAVFSIAVLAALALVSCQTITEEMPNRAPDSPMNVTPIPVVVVPVPLPTPPPATPPPNNPPNSPNPQPTSEPGNNPPGNGDIPDNTNPVAKLTAKVYFVECFGNIVEYPPAPVGCRIHLDVTPTDSSNHHTQLKGSLRWTYTNTSIIGIGGNSPFNPVLDARAAGDLDCWAEADGVRSNTVHITIR